MKIDVSTSGCQGHGVCAMTAPDLFDLSDEDGHAIPRLDPVPTALHDDAQMAAEACPERAITLGE